MKKIQKHSRATLHVKMQFLIQSLPQPTTAASFLNNKPFFISIRRNKPTDSMCAQKLFVGMTYIGKDSEKRSYILKSAKMLWKIMGMDTETYYF